MIRGSDREHPWGKRARYKRQAASTRTSGGVAVEQIGCLAWIAGSGLTGSRRLRCAVRIMPSEKQTMCSRGHVASAEQNVFHAGRCGLSMSHRKARSSVPKHAGPPSARGLDILALSTSQTLLFADAAQLTAFVSVDAGPWAIRSLGLSRRAAPSLAILGHGTPLVVIYRRLLWQVLGGAPIGWPASGP
jgi:hypothetical protein